MAMGRIKDKFKELEQKNQGALITYLMAGDPNYQQSVEYVKSLEEGGADLIELGVPFTDPVADGPTIQEAELRALKAGINLGTVFNMVEVIRKRSTIPLVLMSYYNPLFRMGEGKFMKRCKNTGVDGLIVPDLPVGESESWVQLARKYAIDTIFLVTPETDEERFRKIFQSTSGFLYLVARYGTTGVRSELENLTKSLIKRFHPLINCEIPLVVGFGLSTEKHIQEVINHGADGAVVGSCIVEKIGEGIETGELANFVQDLKKGTKRV